mmetsp:Transcript_17780/g.32115  ORF Transcript_17780/g.32115 Transcript_17780/m.32115 type:complete len:444 (-) Transcript_17780:402-1733(-)
MLHHIPLLPSPLLLLHHCGLRLLLDKLGNPPRFRNTLDLRQMHVLLHQRLAILQRSFLPRRQLTNLFGGPRLPQSNIGVVAPRKQVFVVEGVPNAKDALHPLRVVHIPRYARGAGTGVSRGTPLLPHAEHPDRLVVTSRNEFGTGGTPRHVHDGANVSLVHPRRSIQLPHIKCVSIVILIPHHEHVRLHRIPLETIALHRHDRLLQRRRCSSIVQPDAAIIGAVRYQVAFGGVVPHGGHRVVAPPEVAVGGNGSGSLGIPEVYGRVGGGGGELVVVPMVIYGVEGVGVVVHAVARGWESIDIMRTVGRFRLVFSFVGFFVVVFSSAFWFLPVLLFVTALVVAVRSCIVTRPGKNTPRLNEPLLSTAVKHPLDSITEHQSTHGPRVRFQIDHHFPPLHVPNSHRPVNTATHYGAQIGSTYRHARYGIDVSSLQFAHEWLGEHSI